MCCWHIFLFARHRRLVRQLPIWLSPAQFNDHFRLGGNVAGQYKRAVALSLQIGIGNFAGFAASNIYRTEDAPGYNLGRMSQCPSVKFSFRLTFSIDGIELGLVGMGLIVLPIIVITYKRANAQREAILKEAGESGGSQYTDEELRSMGDKAPKFRYGI